MVWNYYFISARWLPPLRINKVKVKVNTQMGTIQSNRRQEKKGKTNKQTINNKNIKI